MKSHSPKKIAIVGSGPAGLSCASYLCKKQNIEVSIFEQEQTLSRKLHIASKTKLNLTNLCSREELIKTYQTQSRHFHTIFQHYPPQTFMKFIHDLGFETEKGTSDRILLKKHSGSKLIKAWIAYLKKHHVTFYPKHSFKDFKILDKKVIIQFDNNHKGCFDAVCLALGGQSYLTRPNVWVKTLKKKDISFSPFKPANVGYEVNWNKDYLKETSGKPLKNISLSGKKGNLKGDLVITSYGLEGTPVYILGSKGTVYLDLKPDLTKKEMHQKLIQNQKNLNPYRLISKKLNLCPVRKALLFHHASAEQKNTTEALIDLIKKFPIKLVQPRPLQEAISTAGGIKFENCDQNLMLKKHPGVFVAGEMLDWTAPTGGFLIQACVSQGQWVGKAISTKD